MLTKQEIELLIEILNRAGTTNVEKYAVAIILNKLLDSSAAEQEKKDELQRKPGTDPQTPEQSG